MYSHVSLIDEKRLDPPSGAVATAVSQTQLVCSGRVETAGASVSTFTDHILTSVSPGCGYSKDIAHRSRWLTAVATDSAALRPERQRVPDTVFIVRSDLHLSVSSCLLAKAQAHACASAYHTWVTHAHPSTQPVSLHVVRRMKRKPHACNSQHPPPVTAVPPPLRTNRVSAGSKPPSGAFSSYTAHSGVGAQ